MRQLSKSIEKLFHSHRKFCDSFAQKHSIQTQEQWYQVTNFEVKQGGRTYLSSTQFNFPSGLADVYPEFTWLPWKFVRTPKKIWEDFSNHRKYFDWLSEELNIDTSEKWYDLSWKVLRENNAIGVIGYYNGLFHALSIVYPQFNWTLHPQQTKKYPNNKSLTTHFSSKHKSKVKQNDRASHRRYCDWLANELGIRNSEDWYSVTRSMMEAKGASNMLKQYGSIPTAIQAAYPEHDWLPWKFEKVPNGYWSDVTNRRKYFDWLVKELGMRNLKQLLRRVTAEHMKMHHGGGLLLRYDGSVMKALRDTYPSEDMNFIRYGVPHDQVAAFNALKSILNTEILVNFKHPELVHGSERRMELDIYIPSLKLAFECQGMQHYKIDQKFSFGEFEQQMKRDEEKRSACRKMNITLIDIPYWWDCSVSSLISTIKKYSPTVF